MDSHLNLPHEVVFWIARTFLENPKDRLNLALVCKTHKDWLLDGSNAAHLFWVVPFAFFAKREMWDMLQFRKSFGEYDASIVLTRVSAPDWMLERALVCFQKSKPALGKVLRLVRNDRSDLDCSKLIADGVDKFHGMSVIFAVAVRYESVNVMANILDRHFKHAINAVDNHQLASEQLRRILLASEFSAVARYFNSNWVNKLCRQYGLEGYTYKRTFGYRGACSTVQRGLRHRDFEGNQMLNSLAFVLLWLLVAGIAQFWQQ